MITRRSLFRGLGASLALVAAPSIVRAASLMPISAPKLVKPSGLSERHFNAAGEFTTYKRYSGYEMGDLSEDDLVGIEIWRGGMTPSVILQGRVA